MVCETEALFDTAMSTLDQRFKRVGYLEYVDENGLPHYEYNCRFGCETCVHQQCHWATLQEAGFPEIAARLKANAEAKDWAGNWGKMVYEERRHGDDAKRRKLMAAIIKGMRKGVVDYGAACIGGCWAGVLLDH